ncbi:nascent polypeptide-associated complex subunit alpha, muscle-specific form isoform X1 [Drosophila mauritiana]|uniref:Nascent polypeptide-associated complex subunit alpha, muscle-specific form isoform X1 n=1 Tax=Drosophila mauritiana TaxID=7226 RepID=A0A6P8KGA5_DROMA|nr:nascent polypeptide-associated complex subunit alpha, muscle-specific form isoform X1 [Drosophila mauritiana]
MVNVPPLLCSTPPPIDFGEEDDDSGLQSTIHLEEGDEYSNFGLVSSSKEPPPPPDPVEEFREKPPDLLEDKQTAEAFNYQVKQTMDYDVFEETAPPTPPPLSLELDDEELEEQVPSLKLDSLSLYSTESVSAASTLSPVAETSAVAPPAMQTTKAHVLSHQVTLEDVSDDSDEECSPKKPKELFIREGAVDFFAIEVLATPTQKNGEGFSEENVDTGKGENVENTSQPKESFRSLEAQEESSNTLEKPLENQIHGLSSPANLEESPHEWGEPANSDTFSFKNFEATPKDIVHKEIVPEMQEPEDDDDFGDFADFSAAEPQLEIKENPTSSFETPSLAINSRTESQPLEVKMAPTTEESSKLPPAESDDGFDDFQEFATPANGNHGQSEDDDDFGDFAEPVVAPVSVPPPPPPAAVHLSIDERVKPVLEMMFPQPKEPDSKSMDNRRPLAQCQRFNFGAIEHAQALDYQWSSSEMRHALVRSLGIDSRNILFGDKWNSSMPRFAANLSFDPLKPLKPQSTGAASSLEPISNPTSYQGLENAPATTASQTETRTGSSHGEGSTGSCSASNSDGEERPSHSHQPTAVPSPESNHIESTAAASAAAVAAAAATLPTALSADSPAHKLNGGEQLHQQRPEPEQFDLRTTPPAAPPAQEEVVGSTMASYSVPLKETHIYTPSKSDTAVAKTTTLAPIDFDYEMAATGIIIDETVVKKEYRDVEYKPPFGLDSPSKLSGNGAASSFQLPPQTTEDDDFSDFQSMPAPRSRIDTPTFGEQMILSPAILLPQAIPLAKKPAATIEWGDNALSSINAEEMARIEELFSSQAKPLTISASVAKKPAPSTPAQSQPQEDDEWSDFVSVPVTQQQSHHQQNAIANNNNVVNSNTRKPAAPKEDDWSDFVSSTPPTRPAPQFNSGAWQSANFYNNPLSLYQAQQQLQQQPHSNLVPKGSTSSNNNNVPAIPQQIHIMHDFSTAPVSGGLGVGATYQQQHQRQQFQIGNAKVAPRISLIPDLSFVAPALPTNAGAFMGALPKPSFGGKK